jgi:hypothetical protein
MPEPISEVPQPYTVLQSHTSTNIHRSVLNKHALSPCAALQEIVKTTSGKKPEVIEHDGQLSSEALALCQLLARILMRCLREQDEQVLKALSLLSEADRQTTGGTHDPAV